MNKGENIMNNIMVVVGTRPEIIKMASVVKALKKEASRTFLFIAVNIMTMKCLKGLSKNLNFQTHTTAVRLDLAHKEHKRPEPLPA